MLLSPDLAAPGEPATPPAPSAPSTPLAHSPLTRREARALQAASPLTTEDFVEVTSSRPVTTTTAVLPILSSEPTFAYTPAPVLQQPSRRDARPVGRNGKRLTDRQIARSLKATARNGRPTDARTHQHRGQDKPRLGQRLLSLGAMLFAGALLVGMSVPANAFITQSSAPAGSVKSERGLPAQTLDVDSELGAISASRDAFSVLSWAEVLSLQYGDRSYEYTVGTGTVRWPFPFASPISDGYGERAAPCSGCSSFHNGVDFTPGGGSPIYAIADGVVSFAEVSDYGYGNHVRIVSTINGEQVEALYAHMQMNSSPLKLGDVVSVGDFIGLVGSTGTSTGSHLHLEIKLNGVNVDPFAYLQATVN